MDADLWSRVRRVIQEASLWNRLRAIGNSPIAKSTVAIPLLGYFLLFNNEVLKFLQLHAAYCSGEDCVLWKLHLLYFGACLIAIGALVYAVLCPVVVKKHLDASSYYNDENRFLRDIRRAQDLGRPNHEHMRIGLPGAKRALPEQEQAQVEVADLMQDEYRTANLSHPMARRIVLASYVAGALLLFFPTIYTFGQILSRFWTAIRPA